MAFEIVRWKCQLCNTEYTEKATALRCEEAHQKPIITKAAIPMEYHSIFGREGVEDVNYPDKIKVKFENGVEQMYYTKEYRG